MSTTHSEKIERLKAANEFIQVIASCGRRFFEDKGTGRIAVLMVDGQDQVWIIDEFTQKRVNTHIDDDWYGFNHGGGLRNLVQNLRDFITKGWTLCATYFTPTAPGELKNNHWGYTDEDMLKVRDAGQRLGLIGPLETGA